MKKLFIYLPVLFISLGLITSCNDQKENITNAMFIDDGSGGGGGGGGGSDTDLNYSPQLVYDADINDFLNRDDGSAEWNEIVGFDFYVQNTNSSTISNVSVQISSVSPSSYVSEYTTDPAQIEFISAFSQQRMDNYWCFNCDTEDEIRIGNFYIVTIDGNGRVDLTINYSITYTLDGNFNSETYSQTIEID